MVSTKRPMDSRELLAPLGRPVQPVKKVLRPVPLQIVFVVAVGVVNIKHRMDSRVLLAALGRPVQPVKKVLAPPQLQTVIAVVVAMVNTNMKTDLMERHARIVQKENDGLVRLRHVPIARAANFKIK